MTLDEPTRLEPASQSQIRAARRLVRRKGRAQAQAFLADGPQAVREALRVPGLVTAVFADATAAVRHHRLIRTAAVAGLRAWLLEERDLASLSETVTPQGIVAVCRFLDVDLDSVLAGRPRLMVCCARVRDPGNAGTVIRCADAFGASGVILSTGSVEVYNAKTVRASAGSIFHLPVVIGREVLPITTAARAAGLQVLAADGRGEVELNELADRGRLARPTLWLFGNEAWGLPTTDRSVTDEVVRVPIYGTAESLNLATAAAVCLYASATAQRRAGS